MAFSKKKKRLYNGMRDEEKEIYFESEVSNAVSAVMQNSLCKGMVQGIRYAYNRMVNNYLVEIDKFPVGSPEWISEVNKMLSHLRIKSIEMNQENLDESKGNDSKENEK